MPKKGGNRAIKSNSSDVPSGSKAIGPRRNQKKKAGGFECSYCDKKFATTQGRGGHITLAHKDKWADSNKEFEAIIAGQLKLTVAPPTVEATVTGSLDVTVTPPQAKATITGALELTVAPPQANLQHPNLNVDLNLPAMEEDDLIEI
ncbi:hypothetical protein FRX31_026698 [Thalictrum thalictroides]|uniref:C2H2-type domain-containing protein n=1 Tax=Thalictrum thalictroides TaxID=46969 RepID=A0A7J6VF11_THATH|nr:hypothetical protein FRX31_026698 [Thalictrum thalictroides]